MMPIRALINRATVDPVHKRLEQKHGKPELFQYTVVFWLLTAEVLCDLLQKLRPLSQVPRSNRENLRRQREAADDFLREVGSFLQENRVAVERQDWGFELGSSSFPNRLCAADKTSGDYIHLHGECMNVVTSLIPDYGIERARRQRAAELTNLIRQCPAGEKSSREFELIGEQVLNYLFVPPFSEVLVQVADEGGHERRDAVLPNHLDHGLWARIRQEFDCRQVVCEFKNGSVAPTQHDINQLRIYLSNPALGRFGLLFTRQSPSKSFLRAQREAYDHSRVLVLCVHDGALFKMLNARAYVGNTDFLLERLKIEFELRH